MMQFFYLLIVGILNLGLGLGIGQHLKRRLKRPADHPPAVAIGSDTAASSSAKGPLSDTSSTADRQLGKLVTELDRFAADFDERFAAVDTGDEPVRELETLANEVDSQVRQLLQLVNSAVDAMSETAAEGHPEAIDLLENCWSDINDDAVKLVTLTFDENSTPTTQATLAKACQGLGATCRQASNQVSQLTG